MGGRGGSSGISGGKSEWLQDNTGQKVDLSKYYKSLPKPPDSMDEFPALKGTRSEISQAESIREKLNEMMTEKFSNASMYMWSTPEIKEYIKKYALISANNGNDLGFSVRKTIADLKADIAGYNNYKKIMSNTDAKWWIKQKNKLKEIAKNFYKSSGYSSV